MGNDIWYGHTSDFGEDDPDPLDESDEELDEGSNEELGVKLERESDPEEEDHSEESEAEEEEPTEESNPEAEEPEEEETKREPTSRSPRAFLALR